MALLGKKSEICYTVEDAESGAEYNLYYDKPAHELKTEFSKRMKEGKEGEYEAVRVEFGKRILKRIDDGVFGVERSRHEKIVNKSLEYEGDMVPISSDPASKFFVSNWKDIVIEYEPLAVAGMAYQAFDVPVRKKNRN